MPKAPGVASDGLLSTVGLTPSATGSLADSSPARVGQPANSPAFGTLDTSFPVAWLQIGGIVVATFVASMLATLAPANRAAAIRPALALRISD